MEKWTLLDQKHGLTPLEKMSIFRLLDPFCFYSLECRFCRSRILYETFSWPILPKNKKWKNGHFWTKTMGYPLCKNVNFSTFWASCCYSVERRFFVLEYHKRHLPGLYCLKKHLEKWNVFGPKQWVNPFGKMSNFPLFKLLVFIA